MKKVLALAFTAGMFTLVSCGLSAEEKQKEGQRVKDSVAAAESAMKAAEEAAAAAAKMDSTAKVAVDTTKKMAAPAAK